MSNGSASNTPGASWRRPATASRRSPAPAATALQRRCAAPSSEPSARHRPSTAAASARRPPSEGNTSMQIAIVLFDRFTALDAVGPYEILSRLPDAQTVFVAERTGPVRADTGFLAITADRTLAEVPRPDIVVVPGGPG